MKKESEEFEVVVCGEPLSRSGHLTGSLEVVETPSIPWAANQSADLLEQKWQSI